MKQNPFPEERKKREQGRQVTRTKEERRRETSTGSPAGTWRSQQIMRELGGRF